MKFNHIKDIWNYLDNFKTPDELKKAFENIPYQFGDFSITNEDTYKDDEYIVINNHYYDNCLNEYEDDFHCIDI